MGTIGGGYFAGLIAETLRLAAVVRRLRRTRRAARIRAQSVPDRAAARGMHEQPRRSAPRRQRVGLTFGDFLRLVGAHADAALPARRLHVRELRGRRPALVDAEVPVRRFHMGLAMSGLTATIFVQLASMAGAPIGGWLADAWRRRSPRGRMAVQAIGMFGGAPFVVVCGLTQSVGTLIVALTCGASSRASTTPTSSRRSSTSSRRRRAAAPPAS